MKRAFLVLCASSLAACGGEAERPAQDGRSPSHGAERGVVLLVTVDDARADRFGFLGAEPSVTPNLDRLAGESGHASVFRSALTVSTSPSAALATILTGALPTQHGLFSVGDPFAYRLGADTNTLAEEFREHGYRTVASVSSWLQNRRLSGFDRGFDVYIEGDPPRDGTAQGARDVAARLHGASVSLPEVIPEHWTGNLFGWAHFGPVSGDPTDLDASELALVRDRLAPFAPDWPELAQELTSVVLDADAALERLSKLIGRRRGSPVWTAWRGARLDVELARIDAAVGALLVHFEDRDLDLVFVGTRGHYVDEKRPDGEVEGFSEGLLRVPLLVYSEAGREAPATHEETVGLDLVAELLRRTPGGPGGPDVPHDIVLAGRRVLVLQGGSGSYASVARGFKRIGPEPGLWIDRALDRQVAVEDVPLPVRRAHLGGIRFETRVALSAQPSVQPESEPPEWGLELRALEPEFPPAEDGAERSPSGRSIQARGSGTAAAPLELGPSTLTPRPALTVVVTRDGKRPREAELSIDLGSAGPGPLLNTPLARVADARAPAWSEDVDGRPLVDVTRGTGGWWTVAVGTARDAEGALMLAEGTQVELFLAAVGEREDPLQLEGCESSSDPELPGMALVVGQAPLELRVRTAARHPLALFVTAHGAGVPVESVRYVGKRFQGDALELYLPPFLPERPDWYRLPEPQRGPGDAGDESGAAAPGFPTGADPVSASITLRRTAPLPNFGVLQLNPEEVRFLRRMARAD